MKTSEQTPVIIIDDDPAAVEMLRRALGRAYDSKVTVLAIAGSRHEADPLIEKISPSLLFLDVELPDSNGLEYAAELHARHGDRMRIVMYTAYDKYLIGALRQQAFDFLLKPVADDELAIVMSRYEAAGGSHACSPRLPKDMAQGHTPRIMLTTATNDKLVLRPDDVGLFRFDTDRKRWEAMATSGQACMLFGQTTADDILAIAPQYIRIHKTMIININHLAVIHDNVCVMMPPFDKVSDLKISRLFRKELTDRFFAL